MTVIRRDLKHYFYDTSSNGGRRRWNILLMWRAFDAPSSIQQLVDMVVQEQYMDLSQIADKTVRAAGRYSDEPLNVADNAENRGTWAQLTMTHRRQCKHKFKQRDEFDDNRGQWQHPWHRQKSCRYANASRYINTSVVDNITSTTTTLHDSLHFKGHVIVWVKNCAWSLV